MEGKEIIEKCQNEIAVKHGYADWFQIDMTEDSECEKNEVKQRLMIEVAELCVSQLQSELEKAKELLSFMVKVANGKMSDKSKSIELRFEKDTLGTWIKKSTTFLEGSGNKNK